MSAHSRTPELPRVAPRATLRFGDYELDFARSELRRAGALVALQPTPLRVLLYLAEHRDRTVPRRELLDAIWPGVVVGDEALTTALAEARHAVGDDGAAQRVIRTLKGQGYRFVAEASAAQEAGLPSVGSSASEERSRLIKRIGIGAAASALALAAVLGGLSTRPSPVPESGTIVVLPFAVRGSAHNAHLREGLVEVLSAKIALPGQIRPVDPQALLAYVSRELRGEVSPEAAVLVARHFGARHYVLGSLVAIDERVRLEAGLYDVNAGTEPVKRLVREGEAARLLAMFDAVAIDVITTLVQGRNRIDRLPSLTTRSPEALRAYLEGNTALQRPNGKQAAEAYGRAVELDPNFALAWYRLGAAQLARTDPNRAPDQNGARGVDAIQRAAALASTLSQRDRDLLEARAAETEGRLAEAETLYGGLAEAAADVDAWTGLGELYLWYNPYRGRSASESIEAFERAIQLDPSYAIPRVGAWRESAGGGDASRGREHAKWLAENADDFAAWAQVTLAYTGGSSEERAAALARLAAVKNPLEPFLALAFPPSAKDAYGVIASYKEFAALSLGLLEFRNGRIGPYTSTLPAVQEWFRVRSTDNVLGDFPWGYLNAFPFVPQSDMNLRLSIEMLRGLPVGTEPLGPPARAYLIGLLAARRADWASVDASLRELAALVGPPVNPAAPAELATSLRGFAAWQRGDAGETLRLLRSLPTRPLLKDQAAKGFYARLLDRYLIGLALEATGELEPALGFHDPGRTWMENILDAPRALRRAQIFEKLGRQGEAVAEYEEAIGLWSHCDPEMRPQLEQARARVAASRAALAPRTGIAERPADVGTTVSGYQDDFDGTGLDPRWVVRGANVFSVRDGALHMTSALAGQQDLHLLYEQPGYDDTVQEVLARIRVRRFGFGDVPRDGIAVAVDPTTNEGLSWVFRNEPKVGQRHFELLDDMRAWGPELARDWLNGSWYWLRVRHEPNAPSQGGVNDVFAKVWLADGSEREPPRWQVTRDYTPLLSTRTGFAGLRATNRWLHGGPGVLLGIDDLSDVEVDYVLIKAAGLPSIVVAPHAVAAAPDTAHEPAR